MVMWRVFGVYHIALTPRGNTPHSLPTQFITREHMRALQRALLEWLVQGNPPYLWTRGCLNQGILPPQGTCTCPYVCLSIAATNLLLKGKSRLAPSSPFGAFPIPLIPGTTPMETHLHPLPITEAPMDQNADDNPHRSHDDSYPTKGGARSPLFAQQAPTNKRSTLILALPKRDLHRRGTAAKRAHSVRVRVNKRLNQPMLTYHWSALRPASFSGYHWTKAHLPLIPKSLLSLGWKRDPSQRIRLDLPKGAPFLFPHSTPGSPPHIRRGPPLPDSD